MSSRSQHRQWSISRFEKERYHLCDWLQSTVIEAIEQGTRRILVRAPVKSGKRQMVEYLAMRDHSSIPTRKHIYLTAWHRKADEEQRAELKCYDIEVFSGITGKKKEDYNTKISTTLQTTPQLTLIIHIDECDHGSAERQVLAEIWREWHDNARIIFILYSATPEEVIYSGEIDDEEMIDDLVVKGVRFDYTPPETFCGPAKFLDEGLVYEARPFFEKVLELGAQHRFRITEQGRQIMTDLREQMKVDRRRNILMLRLSYDTDDNDTAAKPKTKQDKKAIHQFLKNLHMFPELKDCQIYVDKDEAPPGMNDLLCEAQKIGWSRDTYWRGITTEYPVIVVNDQTCSRSTELAVHDRIFAYHDYRRTITFSVCSQAFERPNHYSTKYSSGFQPIRIYCHEKTMLLSAGRISYDEYIHIEWVMRKQNKTEMFQIKKNDHTKAIHPDYPNPMTEADANKALLELRCDKKDTKLSTRVKGTIEEESKIDRQFVPCKNAAEFNRLRQEGRLNGKHGNRPRDNLFEKFKPDSENPDQRFQCKLRDEQKARTMEELLREKWAVSKNHPTHRHICYNEDGVCGVLILSFDGYCEVDTLTADNSMYCPRKLKNEDSSSSGDSDDTD